jgi:hypothetical protein
MTKDKRYWIIVNNIKAKHPDWDQKTVLIRAKYAYQKRYATEQA